MTSLRLSAKLHPMNIVAESRVLNLQFWVCADGGYGVLETYHISERPLNNYTIAKGVVMLFIPALKIRRC